MTEQPTESHLLSAYDLRWKNYRSQYKTCRIEFSEEAVHDLRVTARRLLAVASGRRPRARRPTTYVSFVAAAPSLPAAAGGGRVRRRRTKL